MRRFARLVDQYWFFSAPAERLAMLRILIGGFALGYVIVRAPHLSSFASMSIEQFQPIGVVSWLRSPLPQPWPLVLVVATAVSGVAFVCAFRFAVSGPIFAALLLWVTTYRNCWGQIFHSENLTVLHVAILAFTRAGDVRWPGAGGRLPSSGVYGWPIRLMGVVTVLTYFVAGVAKIRHTGFSWVGHDVLLHQIAMDNLRKVELGHIHSPVGAALMSYPAVIRPFAWLTMVVELCAPAFLVSRRASRYWVMGAIGFHWGVFALMAIVFPYPMFGFAFASFFEVERLPSELRALLARHRRRPKVEKGSPSG